MPRVLIVDDESAIRFALRRWFERQGWLAVEANDGAIALELLLAPPSTDAGEFAVVVCDLRMPGVSGMEVAARLASDRPDVLARVIFTTGDDVAAIVAGTLLVTQGRLLQKPFEFSVLREAVESITGTM